MGWGFWRCGQSFEWQAVQLVDLVIHQSATYPIYPVYPIHSGCQDVCYTDEEHSDKKNCLSHSFSS